MIIKNKKLNIVKNEDFLFRKKLFSYFSSIFVFLFLFYIIFLGKTVFNIVERKNIENDVRIINSEMSQLEIEYLSLSNKVDMELASSLGFLDKNVNFISNKIFVKNLDINKNVLQ